MKSFKNILSELIAIILMSFLPFGCNENQLDLNPLAEGSSEGWYSTDKEIRMSVDYLYDIRFWNPNPDPLYFDYGGWIDHWSDDWTNRSNTSAITGGTINSQTTQVEWFWRIYYQGIAAANLLIENINENKEMISEKNYNQYLAETRFARAHLFSKLIFYYGDVPYSEKTLTIEEAFSLARMNKNDILEKIYEDFDYAIQILPESYSNTKYATKGAALALKARIALYMGDWPVARDAAKACMDLNVYELYPDFFDLFLTKNNGNNEIVWSIPRSVELNSTIISENARQRTPRLTTGGNAYVWPSWDLLCSFLCTDGLPIDKSPLYNPHKPFKNRDPRCTATIVEHGTFFADAIFEPHPDSLLATNTSGQRIPNRNSMGVDQWAPWNGIMWNKGYDSDWWDDFLVAPEQVVIRYADVLMIYAEAKIELNDIDQSVLDAMNKIRSRAYGVDYTAISLYPAITSNDQSELKSILRFERRMEFALEGLRHADLIRWKIAEKALNKPLYGMLEVSELRENIVNAGLWFFPETTPVDADGIPEFEPMYEKKYIRRLALRSFDASKHYLWPIPAKEIQINKNLIQNPGY